MAMLILKSSNPQLSHILGKNPESGMISRGIRKGTSFGWFGKEDEYVIYFKDADNEISYKKDADERFEYMNKSRYNSPLFVLNAVNDYFSSALKNKHDDDVEGYIHELTIPMMEIERFERVRKLFNYIQGIEIGYKKEAGNSYEVVIKTSKPLYELLHLTIVLGLFTAIFNGSYIDITKELAKKYTTSMNILDVPYYIRYTFINQVIISKEMFRGLKEDLEKTDRYELELVYGNTAEDRRNFVTNQLDFNRSILDLGCGEGYYTLPYSKRLKEKNIYAVDIDEEVLSKVTNKALNRELDNVWTFLDLEVYQNTMDTEEELDVIMVEVLEHMDLESASNLAEKVISEVNFNKFIMTTPNEDFNIHYEMEGMRHPDHVWEMTEVEFKAFIDNLMKDKVEFDYEFYQIGDKVDGKSPTQGVVITNKLSKESVTE